MSEIEEFIDTSQLGKRAFSEILREAALDAGQSVLCGSGQGIITKQRRCGRLTLIQVVPREEKALLNAVDRADWVDWG